MAQLIQVISAATLNTPTAKLLSTSGGGVVATASTVTHVASAWYDCSYSGVATGNYAHVLYDGGVPIEVNYIELDAANGTWGCFQQSVALGNNVIEGTYTLAEMISIMTGVLAGKTSISGADVTFRNLSDTKNIVVATIATQQRTAITYDV